MDDTDETKKMIGMALFLLGWLVVAYGISIGPMGGYSIPATPRTFVVFSICAAIVMDVMTMKQHMADEKDATSPAPMPQHMPIIFALGWLALGFFSGWNALTRIIGLASAGLVVVSMLVLLPWQRKNGIVDGPGMALFVLGWMGLALANSLV
jgi:hypothetical protein